MSEQSKRFSLNSADIISLGKGLLIACAGAGLTYLTEQIPNVDFGQMTPVVVAAWSIVANIIRKYISSPSN